MRIRGRSQRWVLLLAVLALVAVACSGGGGEAADSGGSEGGGDAGGEGGAEMSYYVGEPEHLAPPSNVTESNGSNVLHALYSPLVDLNYDTSEAIWGDDAPNAVAASVESDDQKTWTITLKDGWTFHDGSPLTAQSYVDTWNEGAANAEYTGNYFFSFIEGYDDLQEDAEGAASEAAGSEAAGSGEGMSGLNVVDDLTFEVTLGEPFSQFPLVINYTAFDPLPESCLADMATCEEHPVGNGPFMMDGDWQHDQSVRVVKYEDFGGEQPAKINAIDFSIYAEVNTAYTDLQAGNLDVMYSLPPEQTEAAKNEFGDAFIQQDSSNYTYLGFPTYDEKFSDPDLRKAISMAIDRQAITDAILTDQRPADSFVTPVVAGYREGACGESCTFDPEAAKQLFDEAGGYDGALTLWFNSGSGHEEWMEAVSNQLRQNLGIQEINFESLDFAQYLPKLQAEEITGPYRLGWIMDYPSPQNYLENLLYTGASSNYTGWSNKEFDELIDQGNAAPTIDEGLEFYAQAEDIAIEEMPNAPLFFAQLSAAHSDRLTNVVFDPQEHMDFTTVEVTE